ncbi:MAG TPA: shikimate dehydrogenase [Sedimentisphaerales bacterium]|jgi:3-dehydroquinate dehydratase/shikimate dehydrogenase|nr:shikimate dehydrogenase [Sedimentisphaerales bacterium]HNU29875.1 shikimate dehydrogenase [Sedimentisphaerales bacterium]
MMTYLAVPISAQDLDRAKRQASEAVSAGAEMLELRTDYFESLDVASVASLIAGIREMGSGRTPVIVTCRDPKEGGARRHPDELRLRVLRTAVEAGADFIDLECANFVRPEFSQGIHEVLATHPSSRLILSAHDFQGRFRDIHALCDGILRAYPGAIPKLVYTASHINDCFEAIDLLHESEGDRIVLCMGEAGLTSRILAKKLGGLVTFASLDDQTATAPGQVTIHTLKDLYRCDSIDGQTELFGVIADPVGHSLSPAIHNASFADQGMNRLYLPLLVQGDQKAFDAFLDNVLARPWLGFRGFSVTIPHKRSALEYVRRKGGFVEPLADQIGAANTLLIERRATSDEPRLSAFNTDYAGALDAITQGMGIERADLRGVPVAVVGAGGVSRAIVAGLTDAGAKVTIYNRTVERAQGLAADFHCQAKGLDELSHLDARLVVNCTSIGMHPNVDATPVPPECIKPGMTVFDTVYNPAETLLLKQAKAAGAKTIDGVAMFVNQAAAQFRLFTGQSANTDLMRRVVLGSLR